MIEIEVNSWNEFARNLRKGVRWEIEKIRDSLISALRALPALEYQERAELLKMGGLLRRGPASWPWPSCVSPPGLSL